MDKLKTILMLVAVIAVAFAVVVTIGFVYTAISYLFFLGIIGLAAVILVRFLMKPGPRQLDAPDPGREVKKIERTLEEYRRKLK